MSFSGVAFTIRQADGSLVTPAYEIHGGDALANVIVNTYALCHEQGATVLGVEVA